MTRVVLLGLAVTLLSGWDTAEDEEHGWASSYIVDFPENEHSSISDWCLREMGATVIAGFEGQPGFLRVVDLNASFFRRGKLDSHTFGDIGATTLEERLVPSPALLSGMPDYSWTIYDWINKNSLCPAVPEEVRTVLLVGDICHRFKGWLGALNSIHFGTQAELTYRRIHELALELATRAESLRLALAEDEDAAVEFSEYAREAEYEALAYEGYAQHFLQDRWSSGHMWERWNVGDYASLPKQDFVQNLLIGSMAGFIHGAESVAETPDPMCSPVIEDDTVIPITWISDDLGQHGGIGDYRWGEVRERGEGFFEGLPYQVFVQHRQLIECGQRGWAEVIRALGDNGSGEFGQIGIVLNQGAPSPLSSATGDECKGAWATNESMELGWGSMNFSTALRIALTEFGLELRRTNRVELGRVRWNLWFESLTDAEGTNLARGELGSFAGVLPGNNYPNVPTYMEPIDLDMLPDERPVTGRDKQAVHGFFNRAHADHWCDPATFATVVGPLRGSADPTNQLVCAYLAERLYRGVDPVYTRRVETRRGISPVPVCHLLGVAEPGDIEDDLPYYVHPGYLDVPGVTQKGGPRVGDPDYLKTIIHWCDKIPVMDVDPEDFVGEAEQDGDVARLTIEGLHFDAESGDVEVTVEGTGTVTGAIESWANDEVVVTFPVNALPDPLDDEVGTIVLTREDGVSTVGERFVRFKAALDGLAFEIADPVPGDIERAEGSPIAAYATSNGVTVIDTRDGEVWQRVARTDDGDFPVGRANVYATGGQIRVVVAAASNGINAAVDGSGALSRLAFIPENQGGINLQYAPGRFVSIGGSVYFFDSGAGGITPLEGLNAAVAGAGLNNLIGAYVKPEGFTETSPMLAVRSTGNPAVDPWQLVKLTLEGDTVAITPVPPEATPSPLDMPLGNVGLKCLPDPRRSFNAICATVGIPPGKASNGGIGLFRWIPGEIPRLSITGILSRASGAPEGSFINVDMINTEEGTRIASVNGAGQVRLDDIEIGRGAEGATSSVSPTPAGCNVAVDVEFRNESSVVVSCQNANKVTTFELPPFGERF